MYLFTFFDNVGVCARCSTFQKEVCAGNFPPFCKVMTHCITIFDGFLKRSVKLFMRAVEVIGYTMCNGKVVSGCV